MRGNDMPSMRPRVFPAEDPEEPSSPSCRRRSFNEAAGIPRGRRHPAIRRTAARCRPSMRPRVFPAEDAALAAFSGIWSAILQ